MQFGIGKLTPEGNAPSTDDGRASGSADNQGGVIRQLTALFGAETTALERRLVAVSRHRWPNVAVSGKQMWGCTGQDRRDLDPWAKSSSLVEHNHNHLLIP